VLVGRSRTTASSLPRHSWDEVIDAVATEYPDVTVSSVRVDALARTKAS
jgi:isocitrate/isopropylmalate dehydrogenase